MAKALEGVWLLSGILLKENGAILFREYLNLNTEIWGTKIENIQTNFGFQVWVF